MGDKNLLYFQSTTKKNLEVVSEQFVFFLKLFIWILLTEFEGKFHLMEYLFIFIYLKYAIEVRHFLWIEGHILDTL